MTFLEMGKDSKEAGEGRVRGEKGIKIIKMRYVHICGYVWILPNKSHYYTSQIYTNKIKSSKKGSVRWTLNWL